MLRSTDRHKYNTNMHTEWEYHIYKNSHRCMTYVRGDEFIRSSSSQNIYGVWWHMSEGMCPQSPVFQWHVSRRHVSQGTQKTCATSPSPCTLLQRHCNFIHSHYQEQINGVLRCCNVSEGWCRSANRDNTKRSSLSLHNTDPYFCMAWALYNTILAVTICPRKDTGTMMIVERLTSNNYAHSLLNVINSV